MKRGTVIAIVKWTLFALVLAYAARSLAKQFVLVDWSAVHFHLMPLIGAIACLLLVPPVQLISYRALLGAYAHQPPLRVMAAVAWVPPLGKYFPGASWVGAYYLLRRFGIPAAIGLSVIVAMDGLAVISGLITGAIILVSLIPHGWIACAAVIAFGAICLHPAVFGRLLNIVLRWSGRAPLDRLPGAQQYAVPVICAFSQWILAGLALWLVTRSIADVSTASIPRFFAIAGAGYSIGYLVIFAPAGLGPRDLIFQEAMKSLVVPTAMSAVAVVVMRIIQTLTELAAAGAGMLVLRSLDREIAEKSLAVAPDPPQSPSNV